MLLSLVGGTAAAQPAQKQKPNILFVFVDDMGDLKLLVARDGSRAELFDVIKDPNETTNLADRHPEVVKRLSEAVIAWAKTIEAGAPPTPTAGVGE